MRPLYHDEPDLLDWQGEVLDARPGAVLVGRSPVFPGGGGQLPDRATLEWAGGAVAVTAISYADEGVWHCFDGDAMPSGDLRITVDPTFRRLMAELHTLAHVANAIVHHEFGGALLTGAQLSAERTFRLDFDLPGADADRLRALADPVNAVIAADHPVGASYMDWDEANAQPGLFRSRNVSPPRQPDGLVRIVEISGLDRQGCGGTHLRSTGQAPRVRVLKVDNKGRQNRRVIFGLAE